MLSGWTRRIGRRPAKASIFTLVLVSLVATLAVTSQVLAGGSGSGCADTHSCMWSEPNYVGTKATVQDSDCCNWKNVIIGQGVRSAKNRFNNRNLKLQNGSTGNVHCVPAMDNRPDPGWNGVDMVKVGEIGSTC
jgi:hypothetical protein